MGVPEPARAEKGETRLGVQAHSSWDRTFLGLVHGRCPGRRRRDRHPADRGLRHRSGVRGARPSSLRCAG